MGIVGCPLCIFIHVLSLIKLVTGRFTRSTTYIFPTKTPVFISECRMFTEVISLKTKGCRGCYQHQVQAQSVLPS
ncbi:hypothetical protein F4810DRAFT_153999 [Camillea tinctor]|nr:hypothetical protein F4810DRAFT_153999 [Camillea tinctor]